MAEFDFKKLTAGVFDYVGPIYPTWVADNIDNFRLPDLNDIGAELFLGKRFFTTLTLMDPDGVKFTLPNEPLMSISLAKTIVETATVGKERKGTVKEYITTEDYQITIRGICVNEEDFDRYPTEQVQLLNELYAVNESLEVFENKFFELFEIRNLVLKSLQFDEMAGQQGLQKYIITAVSDQDFYADLDEREKNTP